MYELKQAEILAFNNLMKNLSLHGYKHVPNTIGIQHHRSRQTKLCLCVDDFGVKYYSKEESRHLLDSLRDNYTCKVYSEGKNYCGLKLNWQYSNGYVDISMPNYIRDILLCFKHPMTQSSQLSPHEHDPIQYVPKTRQYTLEPDTSPLLNKDGIKYVQQVTGQLLYYARAIDRTMLPDLNIVVSE